MSKPAVIRSYLNPNDAYFVKSILDESDIPVVLFDENIAGSTISYGVASGGVKIVVPEPFVDEAIELINAEYSEIATHEIEPSDVIYCPKCDSKQVHRTLRYISGFQYFMLLLGGFLFHKKKKFKCTCRNCRHTWLSY